ncbi:MAG: leucyl aminopeptidase family protein [Rickettsiales bacterium]
MIQIAYQPIEGMKKLDTNATLVVGFKNNMRLSLDIKYGEVIKKAIGSSGFQATPGESFVIYNPPGLNISRIIVVALEDDLREVGRTIYKAIAKLPFSEVHIVIEGDAAEIGYGILDASWTFNKYKTNPPLKSYVIALHTDEDDAKFINYQHLFKGVFLARDLVAEPSNVLTTTEFKDRCLLLAEHGIEIEVLEQKQLEELGMRAVLGISKGSVFPPYVITLKYNGSSDVPIALVGKGVCFDSGGISLKKPNNMMQMCHDMSGAAAVVGTLLAAALQKLPVNVVGVIGLIENMPAGNALKPGDIITAMSGKTIEVITTDAEGRLLLADCLYYTQQKYQPKVMIDLATLTPETIGCLAHEYAGMYTDSDLLANQLYQIGVESGDKVWRLPMGKSFAKQIESKYADVKNLGIEWGGENAAAAEFLRHFTNDCKAWVHLDIAGVAWNHDIETLNYQSIPGYGVKLLEGFLKSQ